MDLTERLYMGNVMAYFRREEGEYFPIGKYNIMQTENTDDMKERVNSMKEDTYECDGTKILLTNVPSTPYYIEIIPDYQPSDIDHYFATPLIKCTTSEIVGVQSGIRSALFKYEGKWYRFKGCGNLDQGFPLAPIEHADYADFRQVRGSMFKQTSLREVSMTRAINDLLIDHHIPVSNIPFGWWSYRVPNDNSHTVEKTCGIYETFGNKRLGDNLLLGLEMLLPSFVPNLDTNKIMSYFPQDRNESGHAISTDLIALTGLFGGLVDFSVLDIGEQSPSIVHPKVDKEFYQMWEQCCRTVKDFHENKPHNLSILGYLYWRLGREAGTVLRILHENNLSWGTYIDPMGTHCNAHVNNFIVLPQGHANLLAPLDFDLAFKKGSFTKDETTWTEWMTIEINGLKLAIAGDPLLTTGVLEQVHLSEDYMTLKWGLRDTMTLGFLSGLENREDIHPPLPEYDDVIHSVMKMALMVTEEKVA